MASGGRPFYLQDTDHDEVAALLWYITLHVSFPNMHIYAMEVLFFLFLKSRGGMNCEHWRGDSLCPRDKGWASSVKHIWGRYLVKDTMERSCQPLGVLSYWKNFSSWIIQLWCDCWWIIVVLLTQRAVVSLSCSAQTVMGKAWVKSVCSQTCGCSIVWSYSVRLLIWQTKYSNMFHLLLCIYNVFMQHGDSLIYFTATAN